MNRTFLMFTLVGGLTAALALPALAGEGSPSPRGGPLLGHARQASRGLGRRAHAGKLRRERVKERFDVNKDGQLDEAERAAAKAAFEQKRAERKAKMLERFDTDKDGTLSGAEREAARAARQERRQAHRAKMLERFDTDKDGKLSEAERAEARKAREARRAEIVKRFDTNGDGRLDETERAAARAALKAEHEKAAPVAPR